MKMIKLGTTIRFSPSPFTEFEEATRCRMNAPVSVIGKIVYINSEHRFFRARYEVHGHSFYECFKF